MRADRFTWEEGDLAIEGPPSRQRGKADDEEKGGEVSSAAEQTPQRPNVLLIVVDQLTAALTGVYGHPVVRTPHLNRLAAEGVRFEAAYSNCPVCGPAR